MYSIKEGVRDAADRFYKPLPEDKFEARWAQMALESPLVKATEAMKQLPPIKISVENAADVIKFGSTVSGVEIDSNSKKMLEDLTRGVKSISKEGRDSFVIERAGKADIPLPAKVSLPGGMAATGIEIDSLRFRIGDGKYPELNGIEGLKVKLEVPTIGRIGQIDNECQIKRLYVTRVPGSSDLELKVVVTNPVPALLRHTIGFVKSDMPTGATIDTKIATLGADGKLK
ncbi:unnamed protein product [Rotaria sordida]|uniref:Uncharacterized protein n=1 Tax=Rotaria sordida TaxID=392033 RepID=A0A813MI09_9BILA|nr:unnamed protein product [Rotaria sordida]